MYYGISLPYCHWCHSYHHRQGTPLNSFLTHIYIYILYTTPTNSSFFSFWIDCEPKQQRHPWHTRPSSTSHEQTSTLEPLLKTFGHTLLAAVVETASLEESNKFLFPCLMTALLISEIGGMKIPFRYKTRIKSQSIFFCSCVCITVTLLCAYINVYFCKRSLCFLFW